MLDQWEDGLALDIREAIDRLIREIYAYLAFLDIAQH